MATQTKKTPEQVEIERLKAEVERLAALNTATQEGKDQTGTYGWTNLTQERADELRCLKQGKKYITQAQRQKDNEEWSARGGDQIKSPVSNTVERDGQTGKIISAPEDSTAKDAKPFEPRPTVDAPPDEKVII